METAKVQIKTGDQKTIVPILIVTGVDDVNTAGAVETDLLEAEQFQEVVANSGAVQGKQNPINTEEEELETIAAAEVANEEKTENPEAEVANEENKENDDGFEIVTPEEAIHWRINFRCRNRVPSDHLYVDTITPTEELVQNSIDSLQKNADGQTMVRYFHFQHELKDSTYKNKYSLQIDHFKLKFSERDDSILIRRDGDATLHLGTSSNTLFRNRNMAMEELRNVFKLNLNVWKSLFISNRADQMGVVDLAEFADSITATNLSVMLDSYPNVVQFIKLHKSPLMKLTVCCQEDLIDICELEQVRTAKSLKITANSNITDAELLSLEADNLEFNSNSITSKGLNAFLEIKMAGDLSENFMAIIENNRENWTFDDVFAGIPYEEYESEFAYREKNGSLPVHFHEGTLTIVTTDAGERLTVIMNKYYFQMFKECKMPRLLSHDYQDLEY